MWFAVLNHVNFIKNPMFNLRARVTPDENGLRLLYQIKSMAFGTFGESQQCAILLTPGPNVMVI